MDQRLSGLASVLVSTALGAWTSLVHFLRTLVAIDVRTYRPEKYYMRGPGPKCAKSMLMGAHLPIHFFARPSHKSSLAGLLLFTLSCCGIVFC